MDRRQGLRGERDDTAHDDWALSERLSAVRAQSARARRLAAQQLDPQLRATLADYAEELDAEAWALERRLGLTTPSARSYRASNDRLLRVRAARANDGGDD
jgi:hypothetical protein